MNSEEAFDDADPEELPAPVAVPVSVPSTPSPSPSTSVPATTLEQPAEIPDPVAYPVPESPTRKSSAAPEPVSKSPVKIPVAVSETEPPPLIQHQSETVPRNSPVRAERRYPARERKAPDRLCDFKNILNLGTQPDLSRDICFVDIRKFKFVLFACILVLLGFETNILEGEEV